MLEEDAANLLEFMKANGLVVNPGKTAFVLLNVKQDSEKKQQVKIGDVCSQSLVIMDRGS